MALVVQRMLEDYGWPILITGGAAYLAYHYLKGARERPAFTDLADRVATSFEYHPNLYRGPIALAVQEAKARDKMLLVYLHKPQAEDPQDVSQHPFLRDVLCTQFLVDLINTNFVCWAGVAGSTDAAGLTRILQVTSHPFLAALNTSSSSSSQRQVLVQLWRMANPATTAEELLVQLVEVVERRDEMAAKQAAEAADRQTAIELDRMLVAQQDQEYQQALQRDQEAAEARSKAQDDRAAELVRRQEEARQVEREAQAVLVQQQQREARRTAKQHKVGEEPAEAAGVCTVRVRLPAGTTAQRRFEQQAGFGTVFDYIESQELCGLDGEQLALPESVQDYGAGTVYNVVTTYPRRVFADPAAKLSTVGGKSIMLIVEEVLLADDEDEGDWEGDEDEEDEACKPV